MNANQIIESATKNCTQDGYTSYPALCVVLESALRYACAEIDTLKGENAIPSRGCRIIESYLGAAKVQVEYEIEGGGGDGWNEPRYEPQINIVGVLINGQWCDAEDVGGHNTIQRWIEEAWQALDDDKAAAEESRAEARRDDQLLEAAPFSSGWVKL